MTRNKVFWVIIISTLVYLGILLYTGVIISKLFQAYKSDYIPLLQVPLNIIPGIFFYFFINYICRKNNQPVIYNLPPKSQISQYKRLAMGLTFSFLTILIVAFLIKITSKQSIDLNRLILGTSFSTMIYMLSPAVSEELLLRGGLLHAFVMRGNKKLGIVISSTFFGVLHIASLLINKDMGGFSYENIVWLFNLAVAGLFFAFLYLRFGLFVAMFAHWFWNSSFSNERMMLVERNIVSVIVLMGLLLLYEIFHRTVLDKNPTAT